MTAKFDSDWDGATPEAEPLEYDPEADASEDTNEDTREETREETTEATQEGQSQDSRRRLSDPEIEYYRKQLDEDLRLTHADGSIDLTAFKTKTFMEAATRGKWLSYLYK